MNLMNKQSNGWASVYRAAPAVYNKFARAQDAVPLMSLLRSNNAIVSKSVLEVGTGTGKYAFLQKCIAESPRFPIVG